MEVNTARNRGCDNYNDNAQLKIWSRGDTLLGFEKGECSETWRNRLLQTFKRCPNARNRVFRHTVRNNRCIASLQIKNCEGW
jgi:hypothetical protein